MSDERGLADRLMEDLKAGLLKRGLPAEPRLETLESHLWLVLERTDVGEVWIFKTREWWDRFTRGDPEERRLLLKDLVAESRMRISVRRRKLLGPDY